jgi:predicted house-cleaning noncanonical NTP pyrophosphatase (MazG superfamily)
MERSKLIRDSVPQIIQEAGKIPETHIANDLEYDQALRDKLVEEAGEFRESGNIDELVDLLEVIHAICENQGKGIEEVETLRKTKAAERGKFTHRIMLDDVQ